MGKRKIVVYSILSIILILILYFGYKSYQILHDNKKTEDEINKIKDEVIINDDVTPLPSSDDTEPTETEPALPLDFEKLKSINSDTVGWIRIDYTNIDYPIVKGRDNVYYLNHSFYKKENVNGWIFENSSNSSNFDDENTVIFGHNTNGHTMFSELKDIYNGDLGTDITIYVYLENKTLSYKVFSIYLENPNNTSNISKYTNKEIVEYMMNKSKIRMSANAYEDDKILTLSTCNNVTNDRLILHAKLI